jgi:CheY-like chemotaxis protein
MEEMLRLWRMRGEGAGSDLAGLTRLKQARQAGAPFELALVVDNGLGLDGFALAQQIRNEPELAATRIIMLNAAGRRGDAVRCRELGIAAYLPQQLRQSELLEAILSVLGSGPCTVAPGELITRHSLREARRSLRILVAEDNRVNQKLVVRLLEKHGYSAVVAGNGREALTALEKEPFDVVLMDVQMPEMDGFEAVAAIRRKEQGTKAHQPVIAITAHAMKGDAERCGAAGMDSYVTKPIHPEELYDAIDELILGRAPTPAPSPVAAPELAPG